MSPGTSTVEMISSEAKPPRARRLQHSCHGTARDGSPRNLRSGPLQRGDSGGERGTNDKAICRNLVPTTERPSPDATIVEIFFALC